MTRPGIPTFFGRFGLLVFASVSVFAVLEISARLWLRYGATADQFQAYASVDQIRERPEESRKLRPHRHLGYVTTANYRSGRNRHNALGFRGDEIMTPKPEGVYRIVCLGGSTTYSSSVEDPAEAYPALLQGFLRSAGRPKVEVINAGVPGYSSLESLINLELRVLDLEPDLLIVQHAINDVHARLVDPPTAYRGDNSGSSGVQGLAPMPALFEHSAALRTLAIRLGWAIPHSSLLRVFGPIPESHRTAQLHAQVMAGTYPTAPFNETSIGALLQQNPPVYFRRNLENLVAIADAQEVGVVLTTFPYHPNWQGKSPLALAEVREAIAESNRVTLGVASALGVPAFDLAGHVPAQESLYTDGYHFTRQGNELRARILGGWMIENRAFESADWGRLHRNP